MSSQFCDVFEALARPFGGDQVKSFSKGGRAMKYVTARTVMNRLDEVLGPENWWDDYVPLEHSVVCRLSLRLPDGQVLTKSDAGGYADMQDEGDGEKGGFSDAFKRAAVKFGVGRHLYNDGVPSYAAGDGHGGAARPPAESPQPTRAPDGQPPREPNFTSLPRAGTGGAFYWFRDLAEHYQDRQLLKRVDELAQAQDLPRRFQDWDQPTLDAIAHRAIAYCRRLPNYRGELDALASPGDEPADAYAAARMGLDVAAQLYWRHQKLTGACTESDVAQMAREFSAGALENLGSCEDLDLIARTTQAIRKAAGRG